jgi:hypothetical protein
MGTIANVRMAVIYELLTVLYETLIIILPFTVGTLYYFKIIVTSIMLSFIYSAVLKVLIIKMLSSVTKRTSYYGGYAIL